MICNLILELNEYVCHYIARHGSQCELRILQVKNQPQEAWNSLIMIMALALYILLSLLFTIISKTTDNLRTSGRFIPC